MSIGFKLFTCQSERAKIENECVLSGPSVCVCAAHIINLSISIILFNCLIAIEVNQALWIVVAFIWPDNPVEVETSVNAGEREK